MGIALNGESVINGNTGVYYNGERLAGIAYNGDIIYRNPGGAAEVLPETVTIVGGSFRMIKVGQTVQLEATVEPANATDKTVTWWSSNTAVATVDAVTGVAQALAAGTASIFAETVNGKTGLQIFSVQR